MPAMFGSLHGFFTHLGIRRILHLKNGREEHEDCTTFQAKDNYFENINKGRKRMNSQSIAIVEGLNALKSTEWHFILCSLMCDFAAPKVYVVKVNQYILNRVNERGETHCDIKSDKSNNLTLIST